jgi:hypothetical protein
MACFLLKVSKTTLCDIYPKMIQENEYPSGTISKPDQFFPVFNGPTRLNWFISKKLE